MEKLFEFMLNHTILVSSFFALIAALIVLESKRGGRQINSQIAVNMMNKEAAQVIDLRGSSEFGAGHITGAINIPLSEIDKRFAEIEKFKDKALILVCAHGQTAGAAGRQLRAKGLVENVYRLTGGMGNWQADKLPVVKS